MTNGKNPNYQPDKLENYSKKNYTFENKKYWEQMFSDEMVAKTLMYQNKYGFDISGDGPTHNNQADAFKHAFMSAVLTLRGGRLISKGLGDIHEMKNLISGANPKESNMDYWNNSVGRSIAMNLVRTLKQQGIKPEKFSEKQLEDWCAEEIFKQMQSGNLITDIKDKRRSTGIGDLNREFKKHKSEINPNLIYTLEQVKKLSQKEFMQNSDSIMSQYRNLGFPTDAEANELVSRGQLEFVLPHDGISNYQQIMSGGKIWVEPYKRGDGTNVSGHYRMRPNQQLI